MRKQDVAEFEVAGSKALSFESSPTAALQLVLGGLVSPHPATSFQPNRLNAIREEMNSPQRMSEALASQFGRFRESLEVWRKCCKRILTGKPPGDTAAFAAETASAREQLEWHCMEALPFLRITQDCIRLSASLAFGRPLEFYLGVPEPASSAELAERAARWDSRARSLAGNGQAFDGEWPLLLARAEFLSDEMADTLKELGRQALWLWTNEPSETRVREIAGWLFDLRCECAEAVPTLTALEPFMRCWLSAAQP